ncbi:hypothetical protein CEUSTIGMA_g361.t1 [Chlamydomonas eustigma]|uniref:Uncharacterized protein n=1 Tax=Chlamydomonas eustigma TaxID=1157962 RepID=A0A250WQC6_9CHLO|nr:hypothetical protein CEUSTIGMA_g361.t1 [Chlamydomonas eustigma]|eukprot:GAX72906.1 hypothetical protein CEUSTIGMA_g361.t1 [Chlamydomonas eustigma]
MRNDSRRYISLVSMLLSEHEDKKHSSSVHSGGPKKVIVKGTAKRAKVRTEDWHGKEVQALATVYTEYKLSFESVRWKSSLQACNKTAVQKAKEMAESIKYASHRGMKEVDNRVESLKTHLKAITDMDRRLSGWEDWWALRDAAYRQHGKDALEKLAGLPSTMPKGGKSYYTREIHDILATIEAVRPKDDVSLVFDLCTTPPDNLDIIPTDESDDDGAESSHPKVFCLRPPLQLISPAVTDLAGTDLLWLQGDFSAAHPSMLAKASK